MYNCASKLFKNYIMASRKNILLLFDVDGTMTKPRQQIDDEFESFILQKVKPLATIGLVGGSDFPKIAEQMKGESVIEKFDYVFAENGLVHYKRGEFLGKESMLNVMGEDKIQTFINFCFEYMSKIKLPAKRGTFIEYRSGMLNVSPVGRSCSQLEREEFALFDTEHKVREKFVRAMEERFSDAGLSFSLGGQISIDVFPIGWDKTYCLNHVTGDHSYEEIHFFGDKTAKGGNDFEIFHDHRTIGHTVTSPEDTRRQLEKLLNIS